MEIVTAVTSFFSPVKLSAEPSNCLTDRSATVSSKSLLIKNRTREQTIANRNTLDLNMLAVLS